MDEAPSRPRRVLILGRSARVDLSTHAERALADGAKLVLVTIGYPVPEPHARAVSEALRLAEERELFVDAALAQDAVEARDFVRAGDEVTIVAARREHRRIERSVRDLTQRSRLLRPGGDGARAPGPAAVRTPVAPIGAHRPELAVVRGGAGGPADEEGPLPDAEGTESVEALAGRDVASPGRETVWTKDDALARKQGHLRIYLGAAPGVGKTYAMLGEGQRRTARGTDVVVAGVQTYGRPKTEEMLHGLEVMSPRRIPYRGTTFDELDADGLLQRRPEVALIDELAHTNVPGTRRAKRWEDVLDLLAAGITVISTLNVQHLASVNDVVAEVTGIRQQETVPDWMLDLADDVELVDMSPRSLQRRMIHGNVYPDPRKADLALRRFFTIENLTALRELALMRVANQVDDELLGRWRRAVAPETRERVLVLVSRPEVSEELIRRGGRIAQRTQGDLLVAHVVTGEKQPDPAWIERTRRLVGDLGGEFETLQADDPVERVLSFATQQHVTQIFVGESRRSRWQELLRGSFVNRLIERASSVDIHVIASRDRSGQN